MKSLLSYVSLSIVLLLQGANVKAFAQSGPAGATPITGPGREFANPNVIVARGLLVRSGKAGMLWTLKTENSPKVRGETIVQVTFTTRPGTESRGYDGYDGNVVELTAEVKSVDRGNAVLRKVGTIGLIDSRSATSTLARSSGSSQNVVIAPRHPDSASKASDRVPYKRAYYLFLASAPHGCEACYVPLLICQRTIEEIAEAKDAALCVFLFTYERDSIWEFRGAASVEAAAIQLPPRFVEVNGRSYRYQEIPPSEVLRLLENPGGTIPISRPYIEPKTVPGAGLNELIRDFHAMGGSADRK